ncbi:MAG: SGNH/GDSL hydrolase family protein [Balneolales bacterium]|nr:SGNH/GDSL hydrolase family protein [Balneolales bacterium]
MRKANIPGRMSPGEFLATYGGASPLLNEISERPAANLTASTATPTSTSPVTQHTPPTTAHPTRPPAPRNHPRLLRLFDQIAGKANARFESITGEAPDELPNYEPRPDLVLACLGDSLTHGRCSFDYAKQVREEFGNSIEVINAGTNGDLAWNVLQRLDQIIACKPDFTSILIGTNDINAIQSDSLLKAYRRVKHIPDEITPDVSWYIQTMRTIIERLQSETQSEVVVFTLPMIAEQASDDINLRVDKYNNALKALCSELGVEILDLNQAQKIVLKEVPADFQLKGYHEKRVEKEIDRAPWFHFALLWDWEKISKRYGYFTLIDGVHLNKRGGSLISGLLVNWLKSRRDTKKASLLSETGPHWL